ncbi:MAG: flavodoxin, partial [Clostridiales bacterium]|nr:flavodoxin [Clostridiales bacterium]
MKKIIPLLVSALMLLSLAACGSKTTAPETTTAPAASGGKTLVVYFSATGNTKAAAEAIAAATDGDLLELEPAEPYTSADLDYNNADSRVSREHDDETLRDVALKTTTVANWADYDTVYIGYPIWWGIAAWPVDTFVKANDFTGKTVIPFCTSGSSDIGESGAQLAALAG